MKSLPLVPALTGKLNPVWEEVFPAWDCLCKSPTRCGWGEFITELIAGKQVKLDSASCWKPTPFNYSPSKARPYPPSRCLEQKAKTPLERKASWMIAQGILKTFQEVLDFTWVPLSIGLWWYGLTRARKWGTTANGSRRTLVRGGLWTEGHGEEDPREMETGGVEKGSV